MTAWGTLVREARERRGMSQAELGDALGIPQATISRWENGVLDPRLSHVEQVNDLLGIEKS